MSMHRRSCPCRDLKLVLEGAGLEGIANQIAAEPNRNGFAGLPLVGAGLRRVSVGGVGLRAAGTRNVAEEDERQKRRSYYTHGFSFHQQCSRLTLTLSNAIYNAAI